MYCMCGRAVHYSLRLQGTDTPLHTTPEAGVTFAVEAGHELRGVAVAVEKMKKGEKAHLVLKPECESHA